MTRSNGASAMTVELFDKSETSWRWVILPLAGVMMVSVQYLEELPAALKARFIAASASGTSTAHVERIFNLLYMVYVAPNAILPVVSGLFTDSWGVGSSLRVGSALLLLGQLIFCIGLAMSDSSSVMALGRFLGGLGGESLTVSIAVLLSQWFKGNELSLAFGVNFAMAFLGALLSTWSTPRIAHVAGLQTSAWVGALWGFACVGLVLVTINIDKTVSEQTATRKGAFLSLSGAFSAADVDSLQSQREMENFSGRLLDSLEELDAPQGESPSSGVLSLSTHGRDTSSSQSNGHGHGHAHPSERPVGKAKLSRRFYLLACLSGIGYAATLPFHSISDALLMERDYFRPDPNAACSLMNPSQCWSDTNPAVNCSISAMYQPPLPINASVSLETIDCGLKAYRQNCATSEYCRRFRSSEALSARTSAVSVTVSIVLLPLVGILLDYVGHRAYLAVFLGVIFAVVHGLLAFTTIPPLALMIGEGVAFALFLVIIWPSVPLVVPEKAVGLGYGILTSSKNLVLTLSPSIVSAGYTNSGDHYIPGVEIMFVCLGVLVVMLGALIGREDIKTDGALNRGIAAERQRLAQEMSYATVEDDDLEMTTIHLSTLHNSGGSSSSRIDHSGHEDSKH